MSAPAEPTLPAPYRIVARRQDSADVFTWTVEPLGEHAPTFLPGQFNMLYAYGIGEVPVSISSAAAGEPLLHTIRAVGSVTRPMAALPVGTVIGLRGPYGTAWPLAEAEGGDLVIVAGGLGLAPLRPAILGALARRAQFGRLCLLYGTRSPADVLFADQLAAWRARGDLELRVTVDRATPDWTDEVGVVTRLIARAGFDPARTTAFVCGPEIMMRFAGEALLRRGVPAAAIHLSLERNMKCAVGYCGHCQLGPHFICRDGPVLAWPRLAGLLDVAEL
ncbi:FAD/NAD(P)-binding protein [Immundisolibacter cernigliae]|uniref:Ni/Fe hydrogenase subunit gamma n=1 Tax=Immundisolibacter cernigliae TaxID=1810504 RepID=A0A1B1YR68_9GAMM|nr:FAD/NAD(P)-binding protein [Immundisolibacter cernigliae]ANX03274.1 Ni/Fe hydrogenase subunit gamma [Immundisolibacter cernigliae]